MTTNIVLNVRERTKKENKADKNNIPGILYGRGIENVMVWVDERDFSNIYDQVGESTVFNLSFPQGDKRNVLIKEVQKDVLSSKICHIDFYQVRMDEEIEAEVELIFNGTSPAVKELGGILVKNMDTINVKCLPGDLPSEIEVDISCLKTFDDHIYVKDLNVSDKVEVLVEPDTVVVLVTEPRSEEELAELESEVSEDVTRVEGVVKEETSEVEEDEAKEEGEKKEEKEKK